MYKTLLLTAAITLNGCASTPQALNTINPDIHRQAVLISQPASDTQRRVKLSLWQFENNRWRGIYTRVDAIVGRSGIAPQGQKKEGDGRTPSGTFELGPAFGYAPSIETRLDYRQADTNDFWVDDPASAQYNQWVHGTPQASSWEDMRRKDDLYKMGIVIGYNTAPIVPGAGSAIFMHIWRRYDHPTAGCVALSQKNLRRILRHLDKNLNPVIVF